MILNAQLQLPKDNYWIERHTTHATVQLLRVLYQSGQQLKIMEQCHDLLPFQIVLPTLLIAQAFSGNFFAVIG